MRTPQRLSAVVLAAVAAAAALAGCSSASSTTAVATSTPAPAPPKSVLVPVLPITVTAANGPVTIKREPTRIVSLDPTATEDLYAVGAGTQVVAVDQDSDYPPGVPVTGLSGLTPNIEAIAKYNPSLVIASQNSGGLVSGLGKLGIPVLIEPAVATVGGAYAQIEQIGQATGHANQANEVVRNMKEEINDAVQQIGTKYQGMTYYWELSNDPYYSATSATFIGHILDLFGLQEHRRRRQQARRRRLPGAVAGVHRHRQAAAHLPGRQRAGRRRPDPGDRRQAARLGGHPGRAGPRHLRPQRRHRVALGPAPALVGHRDRQRARESHVVSGQR